MKHIKTFVLFESKTDKTFGKTFEKNGKTLDVTLDLNDPEELEASIIGNVSSKEELDELISELNDELSDFFNEHNISLLDCYENGDQQDGDNWIVFLGLSNDDEEEYNDEE